MRLILLLLPLLAACAPGPPAGSLGPAAQPTARALAALDDSLAAAPGTRLAVLRRALARGGVSPLSDPVGRLGPAARYQSPLGGASAAGFLPGGSPLLRGEMVLLGASADGPEAAAVALAALVLAERSRWTGAPERTVEVVFWAGDPPTDVAVRAAVRGALWPRAEIRAAVVASEGAVAPVDGLPVIAVPTGAGRLALAQALVAETLRAARADSAALAPTAPR